MAAVAALVAVRMRRRMNDPHPERIDYTKCTRHTTVCNLLLRRSHPPPTTLLPASNNNLPLSRRRRRRRPFNHTTRTSFEHAHAHGQQHTAGGGGGGPSHPRFCRERH